LTVISSVTSSRMNWDKALNDFARIVPTDSFLTTLSFAAPVPTASVLGSATSTTSTSTDTTAAASTTPTAPTPNAAMLTVAGTAPGTVAVARVLDRIALIPWLTGVTLGSASRSGDGGGDSFNITATVTQEP
jgi:Tfp pilus assembly protein PilN